MKSPFWFLSKFNTSKPSEWGIRSEIHLDVGCGSRPRNPFRATKVVGVDILEKKQLSLPKEVNYLKVDIQGLLPLESNSVDTISGYDFIEHLSRGPTIESNHFIKFMNEAYRVLKPNGVLFLVTPAFPSSAAFQDPTHVNFISVNTIDYFTGPEPGASKMGYGFNGSFHKICQEWVGPFSSIWSTEDYQTKQHFLSKKRTAFIRNLRSISTIRRTISNIRNPSHLIWLLMKK